ncbi:MAG: DUF4382 domain-containing protein [Planctomycetes bacterium]|nr:DUF4382 domain-containing protein [Planctomycetota bacterium]
MRPRIQHSLQVLSVLFIPALLIVLAFVPALFLPGCKGSGGGGEAVPGGGTGTVAVLLADGPADDFVEIRIRVTEISLLPADGSDDDGPVIVYHDAGGHEINILDLRDEDFILTINNDVPAGRYDKIRMRVSEIEAVGGPCSTMKLPSGKIDLNPRGPFEVKAGGSITVRLDIDANKSLHIVQAGHSGKCIFRPVVFVDIEEGKPTSVCPRILTGTIAELIEGSEEGEIDGFILALSGNRGEVEVLLTDDTVIFDDEGYPAAAADALAVGDVVRVSGRFDEDRRLVASVVVAGQVVAVKGTVDGPLEDGRFAFAPDAGQEVVGTFDVEIASETLILFGCDQRVGEEEIREGMRARVIGKIALADRVLRAVAVLLRPGEIAGEITEWTPLVGGYRMTVRTDADDSVSVFVPASAPITLAEDGPVPASLICEGHRVRATIAEDPILILKAVDVRLQSESVEGAVASIQGPERLLLIDGKTVHIRPQAVVLIHEEADGEQDLGSFDSIEVGDDIECFGLSTCSDPVVDLEAFVVVINRA